MKRAGPRKTLSIILVIVMITSLCGFYVQAQGDELSEIVAQTLSPSAEEPSTTPSEEPSAAPSEEPSASPSDDPSKALTDSESFPSFTQEIYLEGTQITISAPEGVLPAGTTVSVSPVYETAALQSEIEGQLEGEMEVILAFDITLFDADGNEIQPNGDVNVSFRLLEADMGQSDALDVFHVDEGGSAEQLVASTVGTDAASVSSDSFSIYAVVGYRTIKDSYMIAKGQQLTIENYGTTNTFLISGNWSIASGSEFVSFANSDLSDTNTVSINGVKAGTATIKCEYLSFGSRKTNTFVVTVTDYNYGYLGSVDHVDIRMAATNFIVTRKIVDINGTLISSTQKTLTGYVSDVTSATLDLAYGSDITVTDFEEHGDYEYCGKAFPAVPLANIAGVSAIVDISYTEGGKKKTLEDVSISFSPSDITKAIQSCDGFSRNIPDGLDFTFGAADTLRGTTSTKSLLTVTKAFSGLTDPEIASLGGFTITIKKNGSSDTYTKHLSDAEAIGGVYTWTFTDIKTGAYTISESGYSTTALAAKYSIQPTIQYTNPSATVSTSTGSSINNVSVSNGSCSAKVAFVNTYTPTTICINGTKTWVAPRSLTLPESITVELLKNGVPFATPLLATASKSSNWKYQFSNVPAYEAGAAISYSVRETKIGNESFDSNGRVFVYGTGTTETGAKQVLGCWASTASGYNVTNTYYPAENEGFGSFAVRKYISDTTTRLAGATFTLTGGDYRSSLVTNDASDIVFSSLPVGEYTLRETAAPEGYAVSSTVWTITVTEAGKTLLRVDAPSSGNVFTNIWSWLVGSSPSSGYENGVLTVGNELAEYTISYAYSGAVPSGAPSVPGNDSGYFGDSKTVPTPPTIPGFSFSGWQTSDASVVGGSYSMPAHNVSFTGTWITSNETIYTVKHYTENLSGSANRWSLEATETLHGPTGSTANITPRSIAGFFYYSPLTSPASSPILADGSLVINLYYLRGNVSVRYEFRGSYPSNAVLPFNGSPQTIPYGSAYSSISPAPVSGCVFDGWYVTSDSQAPSIFPPVLPARQTSVSLFGTDAKFVNGETVTRSIVLYGYWSEASSYDLTYAWDGAHPSDAVLPAAKSYFEGEDVTIASNPTTTQPYWTFNGWKIKGSPASNFKMGESDVAVVGSWSYIPPYYPPIIESPSPSPTDIPEESPPLNPSPSISPSPSQSPDPGTTIPEPSAPTADTPVTPTNHNTPQTGDNNNLGFMALLAVLSAAAICAVGFFTYRKKRSK